MNRRPRHFFRRRRCFAGDTPFAGVVADYAHNILVSTSLRRLEPARLRQVHSIGLIVEMARSAASARDRTQLDDLTSVGLLTRSLGRYLAAESSPRTPGKPCDFIAENLALIASIVGLDEVQKAILYFLVALHDSGPLTELAGSFGDLTLPGAAAVVAAAIALPKDSVLVALGHGSRLVSSGLVKVDDDDTYELAAKIKLKAGILDAVLTPDLDRDGLVARFLPEAGPESLEWEDFAHVREAAIVTRDLLATAVRCRRAGVNVLFHGNTGTGKTALARLVAKDIGTKLYVTGRADESGDSADSNERLSSLMLGQRLVSAGSAILLFDEMEDLFSWQPIGLFGAPSHGVALMSKQWFNDLLESNPVPTIWITNNADGIDPAFLRRFAYAMEFRPPGSRQRARVLTRHLGPDSPVSPADVDAIANRFSVSPAQFATAVASARLINNDGPPDRAAIERVLAPVERLVAGPDASRRSVFDATRYRIDAINSPDDITGIADRLASWQPGAGPGVSICLYGPPGTGKSEYVKYLAHRMKRPIVYKRASDILSMWLGNTEKSIAAAFRQAEDDDAVLLFDEVDSFLRDRQTAMRSWEVTQVNELLQQLESFRGVVACTTNLWRDIDEAALRRFVFKVEFRFLLVDQVMTLLRSVFVPDIVPSIAEEEEAMARAALGRVPNLTPGDFSAVARRQRALGARCTVAEIVEALAAEARVKRGTARAIGF
jgi:transitional endoplasmic reticulum ATPase